MLQRLELFATMVFEHYDKKYLFMALSDKHATTINDVINKGTNFSSRICSCSECYNRTLLQLLTHERKFEDIQTFLEFCPKSPADLSLEGNEHGHSIAYVLANANQAALLNNLIIQSSDVQINIAERHHGTSLIDILISKQAWNCITALVHLNMKAMDVKYIPENKQIQECPAQLRELIKENNALVQSKRKKKNTKNITNKSVENADVNNNAYEIVDSFNQIKEGKQEITDTVNKSATQNRIELLDQLLGDNLDYTLKVDKQVQLEIIDTKGNQTKQINALKLFLKTIPNVNIRSNNHSIQLEAKNLQILNDFIHAKYKVIKDALTSQPQASDTNTFEPFVSEDSPVLKRASAIKVKVNKTEAISKKLDEQRTQRQQAKDAKKTKPQTTKSEPKKKAASQEKSSSEQSEGVSANSAAPIKKPFNHNAIEFIPAASLAKRGSTIEIQPSINNNNANDIIPEQKSAETTSTSISPTQSSIAVVDTNAQKSHYTEAQPPRLGLFAVLGNRIVKLDITRRCKEPSEDEYNSQSRMPKYLQEADKVLEQEYETQSRLRNKYLSRQ